MNNKKPYRTVEYLIKRKGFTYELYEVEQEQFLNYTFKKIGDLIKTHYATYYLEKHVRNIHDNAKVLAKEERNSSVRDSNIYTVETNHETYQIVIHYKTI